MRLQDSSALPRPAISPRNWIPGGEGSAWAELPLDDGRVVLLLKPGAGSAARWRSAVAAAELMRHAGLVVPLPSPPRAGTSGEPRVFLRPSLPTLAELWPAWSDEERRSALRSTGQLLRRVHSLRLDGYGPLDSRHARGRPLQWLLAEELGVRGFPAMAAACPTALGIVEGLLETIPEVVARVVGPPRLTHNALHPASLLCSIGPRGPEVVGLGDPGSPGGWPAEADLARLELGLRACPVGAGRDAFAELLDGYGHEPDPVLQAFFRALHVVRTLIGAGPTDHPDELLPSVDNARADMDLVHAAYEARVHAAATSAGLAPGEAAALLPRASDGTRRPAASRTRRSS